MNATVTNAQKILEDVRQQQEALDGCLVVIYPPSSPVGLKPLGGDRILIGRHPDCHIQLSDDSVSRAHAIVARREDGFVIIDSGSTNGTLVNDVPVQEHRLRGGDQIRIGNHILKYLADGVERRYFQTVHQTMVTDPLTAAFNRTFLLETLEAKLQQASQDAPVSLLMMDLDRFKSVNDTFGHPTGDVVLTEFVARVNLCLGEGQLLGRMGGEEFAVVTTEQTREEIYALAESIRQLVAGEPFGTASGPTVVTVSIGVAWTNDAVVSASDLIAEADRCLYQAKSQGRNRVI